MAPIKIKGIVTRSVQVGDYNKMLTVLSPELGKLSVWARGVKSPKHPAHAACSPLCYSEFILTKRGDTYSLSAAEVEESFYHLRDSVEILAYASYFASLAQEVCEGESSQTVRLLLNTLYFLEKGKNPETLKSVFEARLLALSGFAPQLSECAVCGGENTEYFDASHGGVVCAACKTAASKKITSETIKFFDYYINAPLSKAVDTDNESVRPFTEEFARAYVGKLSALEYLLHLRK